MGGQLGVVYWDSYGGSIFTWASRHKLRIFASVQLFWMGPQMPSDPQSLFTTPLLFTGHGACATKPALVTFQATTEKSSGQVVSPSEQGSVRPQQPQYSQSLCSDQNLCGPRYLTQWPQGKEQQRKRPRVPRTSHLEVSRRDPGPTYPG